MKTDYYCPVYHCRMTELGCDIRRKKAMIVKSFSENVFRDSGCHTCTKGYKIVETKRCKKCCETKPMNEFNKNAGTKDKHENTCKMCRKKQNDKYKMEKKMATTSSEKQTEYVTVPSAMVESGKVTIDFSEYMWILDAIRKNAKDDIRTIDGQIMYYLKRHIESIDWTPDGILP